MPILAAIEVDDHGSLVIRNFGDNLERLKDRAQGVGNPLEDLGRKGEKANNALDSLSHTAGVLRTALAALAGTAGLGLLLREVGMLAARVEVLQTVMAVVGKNANVTNQEMQIQVERVKALGITTQEATNAVIQFAQAELKVADAAKVARAAQDLAVVAGVNSSQAFSTLTGAIQSQQPILLRQFGIVTGLDQIYSEYAKTIGKTGGELTQLDKKQAFLNKILLESEKVAGAYEASMSDAGKQIGSFSRFVEEAKLKLGESLLPVMLKGVEVATSMIKVWVEMDPAIQRAATGMAVFVTVVLSLVAAINALKFLNVVGLFTGLLGPLGLVVAAIGAVVAGYVMYTAATKNMTDAHLQEAAAAEASQIKLKGLIKTFDELHIVGPLTVEDQQRYEKTLQDIAKSAPDAVRGVNSLTGAYEIQIDVVRELLKTKGEERRAAVGAAEDELKELGSRLAEEEKKLKTLVDRQNQAREAAAAAQRSRLTAPTGPPIQIGEFGTVFDPTATDMAKGAREAFLAQQEAVIKLRAEYKKLHVVVEEGKLTDDGRLKKVLENFEKEQGGLEALRKKAKEARLDLANIYNAKDSDTAREQIKIFESAYQTHVDRVSDEAKRMKQALEAASAPYEEGTRNQRAAFEALEKALEKTVQGSDRWNEVVRIGTETIQKWNSASDKQKAGFDKIAIAAQQLKDVAFAQEMDEWAKKAGEAAEALSMAGDEIAQGFGRDLRQLHESFDEKFVDTFRKTQEDILKIDRDINERINSAFMNDTERKIHENNKYYDSLIEANNRQIEAIRRISEEERKAIQEKAEARRQEIRDIIEKAEFRFRVEAQYEDKLAKLKDAMADTDKQRGRARALELQQEFLTDLRARGEKYISEINRQEKEALDAQKRSHGAAADHQISTIEDQNRRIRIAQQITNGQILADAKVLHQVMRELWQATTSIVMGEFDKWISGAQGFKETLGNIFQGLKATIFGIFNEMLKNWIQTLFRMKSATAGANVMGGVGGGTGAGGFNMGSVFGNTLGGKVLGGLAGGAIGGQVGWTVGSGTGSRLLGAGSGAATGATAGALFGGPIGALIGGGIGAITGYIAALREWNKVKQLHTDFEKAMGGSDKMLERIIAAGPKAEAAFKQAYDAKTVKAFTEEAEKLKQIVEEFETLTENRKAFIEQAGGLEKLSKLAQTVQFDLKQMLNTKDLKEYNTEVENLNKLLADREKRIQALGVAAEGLEKRSLGMMASLDRGVATFFESFSKKQEKIFESAFTRAQEKGFKGDEFEFFMSADKIGGLTDKQISKIKSQLREIDAERKKLTEGGVTAKEAEEIKKLTSEYERLQKTLKGADGLKITEKQAEQMRKTLEQARAEFPKVGASAVAVFAAIVRETGDVIGALEQVGPTLDRLTFVKDVIQGVDVSESLGKLLDLRKFAKDNEDLMQSISGTTQILKGLTDAGRLTKEMFDTLGADAVEQFERLKERGATADQALLLMQPTLQTLFEAQKNFGFAVDETTQKLIDQAKEQGLVGDQFQDVNTKILDVLLMIAEVLGADIPDAYKKTAEAAATAGSDAATAAGEQEQALRDQQQAIKDAQAEYERWRREWGTKSGDITDDTADVEDATRGVEGAFGDIVDEVIHAKRVIGDFRTSAIDDLRAVEEAANGVAFGHSPGGLKEIKIQSQSGQMAIRALRDATVSDTNQMLASVNMYSSRLSQIIDAANNSTIPEQVHSVRSRFDAEGEKSEEEIDVSTPSIVMNVTVEIPTTIEIKALDSQSVEEMFDEDFDPLLRKRMEANANQLASDLKTALDKVTGR